MDRTKLLGLCCLAVISLILTGCYEQDQVVFRDYRYHLAGSSLTSIIPTPKPQPATNFADTLKAMTFNIRVDTALDAGRGWDTRKPAVIETIKDNTADIVSLQEARSYQASEIQRALPKYSKYAVGRTNGTDRGESCPIFYRKDRFDLLDSGTFWFSKHPEDPGSKFFGTIFPRICSWVRLYDKNTQKNFYVYNLHLDNLSQSAREKSVRVLAQKIYDRKTPDPFIVMGDFNMELDNPAMKYLQKDGVVTPYPKMTDAWQSLYPYRLNAGTHHKFSGDSSCRKVDHIPISRNLQAVKVNIDQRQIDGMYPSDHFPVIATIKFL